MNSNYSFTVHRPPVNYVIKAGSVMSIGVAIMFVVVMCPFCTMHRTMLWTNSDGIEAYIAAVLTGMHVETSLMSIDVRPICGTEISALSSTLGKVVHVLCYGGGNSLWGKHLVFDMNSHACNLEEQLRATGWGFARAIGGDVGCIQFNIAKIVSLVAMATVLAAITFHILAVVHTHLYYTVDQSKRRRCIAVTFWVLGPGIATVGIGLYFMLVNPTRLVLQGLFRPSAGEFYPLGWGTVWWTMTIALSYLNCIGVVINLDHLLTPESVHKYAEYEALSASVDAYHATGAQQYGALEKGVPPGYGPPSGQTFATTADTYAYGPRYG